MFMVALLAAAKVGSNPMSTNRGLNKQNMPYTCKGILFRLKVKKKKEILMHASWVNFEDIVLSETSQSLKDKYCVVPLM